MSLSASLNVVFSLSLADGVIDLSQSTGVNIGGELAVGDSVSVLITGSTQSAPVSVQGCASFGGDLTIMIPPGVFGNVTVMSYQCSSGQFSTVSVIDTNPDPSCQRQLPLPVFGVHTLFVIAPPPKPGCFTPTQSSGTNQPPPTVQSSDPVIIPGISYEASLAIFIVLSLLIVLAVSLSIFFFATPQGKSKIRNLQKSNAAASSK